MEIQTFLFCGTYCSLESYRGGFIVGERITYEKINDLTAINLLNDLMEGKLNIDEYRKINRGLHELFSYLAVNNKHQEELR